LSEIKNIEQLIILIEKLHLDPHFVKKNFVDDLSCYIVKYLYKILQRYIKQNNVDQNDHKEVNKEGYLSHIKSITPIRVNPKEGCCGMKIKMNLDYETMIARKENEEEFKKELSAIIQCDNECINIKKQEKGSWIVTVIITALGGLLGAIVGAVIGGLIGNIPGAILGGGIGLKEGALIGGAIGAGTGIGTGVAYKSRKPVLQLFLSRNTNNEDDETYCIDDRVTIIKNGREAHVVGFDIKKDKKTMYLVEYSSSSFLSKKKDKVDATCMELIQPGDNDTGDFQTDGEKWMIRIKRFFKVNV